MNDPKEKEQQMNEKWRRIAPISSWAKGGNKIGRPLRSNLPSGPTILLYVVAGLIALVALVLVYRLVQEVAEPGLVIL